MNKLATVILVMIACNVNAQTLKNNSILGRWTVQKLEVPNAFFYDVDQIDSSYLSVLTYAAESEKDNSMFSALDSAMLKEKTVEGLKEIRKVFFQFNSDSTYVATKTSHSGFSDDSTYGVYNYNPTKGILVMTENGSTTSDSMSVNFLSNSLLKVSSGYEDIEMPILYFRRFR
jgi:hypothetical protein